MNQKEMKKKKKKERDESEMHSALKGIYKLLEGVKHTHHN